MKKIRHRDKRYKKLKKARKRDACGENYWKLILEWKRNNPL